jgi:type IV pilus assembly protein PilB
MKRKKLGEVLSERGQISPQDLAEAVSEQQQGKVLHLGELLLERSLVAKEQLASALEEVTHIPYVDCAAIRPDPAVLSLIPRSLAVKCEAIPIGMQEKELVIAMTEPQNLAFVDEIKFTVGMNILLRLGFRSEILAAIERCYGGGESSQERTATAAAESSQESQPAGKIEFISTSARQANREAMQEIQAELAHRPTPAVRIVSEMIAAALKKHASDLHLEPQATSVIARIRVDGLLRDLRREPRTIQNALTSRIKILADMDIAERRIPQDGRFLVRMGTKQIEVRVSTLPTQYGEKVVMRLLNADAGLLQLAELKLPEQVDRHLREVLSLPQGLVLVTGPTGSGKSTTLYSSLNLLRRPAVNIVTVEDPVEYVLPGINQVHVNNRAGLTFASCLRSILRQDPNVIMIGEIRDKETAEIAMKASQTGHLVLSTLHTNDSLSAIARLVDLGIPVFLIACSVTAIVSQRLVRRLCACHRQAEVTGDLASRLQSMSFTGSFTGGSTAQIESVGIPAGCDECDQTGYRGRIGIYEIVPFDEGIRDAVREGAKIEEVRSYVRSLGMKSMQEDALDKVVQGITSVEEVMRVVPMEARGTAQCPVCRRRVIRNFTFCPHCGSRRQEIEGQRESTAQHSEAEVTRP